MTAPFRERLRLLTVTPVPRDRGHAILVELEWDGAIYRGEAAGTGTREGDLRASGEATVAAVRRVLRSEASLSVLGMKAVRAFDGHVIIAAIEVRTHPAPPRKLLGAHPLGDEDMMRAGALTVLGAINRVLSPLLPRDAPPA